MARRRSNAALAQRKTDWCCDECFSGQTPSKQRTTVLCCGYSRCHRTQASWENAAGTSRTGTAGFGDRPASPTVSQPHSNSEHCCTRSAAVATNWPHGNLSLWFRGNSEYCCGICRGWLDAAAGQKTSRNIFWRKLCLAIPRWKNSSNRRYLYGKFGRYPPRFSG